MSPIFVLVKDLLFKSKIAETAKLLEKEIVFIEDIYTIKNPTIIIADLEVFGLDGLQKLKAENPSLRILGFLSHKNIDLITRARIVEIEVFPRSIFFQRLGEIL
jgi:hypothetical protein